MSGEPAHSMIERQMVAFVVLRHDDGEGTHYDLMIDTGEKLATWKCPQPPESAHVSPLFCRRIDDHRRIYLEYEGPISGNRGEVRQHDRGYCRILEQSADRWRVAFNGGKLAMVCGLVRVQNDSWQISAAPP